MRISVILQLTLVVVLALVLMCAMEKGDTFVKSGMRTKWCDGVKQLEVGAFRFAFGKLGTLG